MEFTVSTDSLVEVVGNSTREDVSTEVVGGVRATLTLSS